MFTGIVQHVGLVRHVDASPRGGTSPAHRLDIELGPLAEGLALGASVAVNGACLTLVQARGPLGTFDAVAETWRRTALADLRVGARVNLERSLRVGDPLDGHFVQGHVDGVGVVDRIDRSGQWKLWVRCDAGVLVDLVEKGAVALDGVSLTLIDVESARFSVALIPATLERTTLGDRRPGDRVNIETDILARIVRRQIELQRGPAAGAPRGGLDWTALAEHGLTP